MEKEKIHIKVEELRDIVFNDSNDYIVIQNETTGHWRHGSEERTIVQRISDTKYFKINWRDSIKEECEFEDMNYDEDYEEVFPVEKTIIVYE